MRTRRFLAIFLGSVAVIAITLCVYSAIVSSAFAIPSLGVNGVGSGKFVVNTDKGGGAEPVGDDRQLTGPQDAQIALENIYRQSIYELTDCMNNLSSNLSKIGISNCNGNMRKLFIECGAYASSAITNLSVLPQTDGDETLEDATIFINQLSDYSHCLANKLAIGDRISMIEKSNLMAMGEVAESFYTLLREMAKRGDYMVVAQSTGSNSNEDEQSQTLFTYPSLVYDGPYADSIKHKTISVGTEVDDDSCIAFISDKFADYSFTTINHVSDVDTDKVMAKVFECTDDKGCVFSIVLTNDCRVLQLNTNCGSQEATDDQYDEGNYRTIAQDAMKKLGFDVVAQWASKPVQGRVYVNLCYVQDNVIVYPDMVKVGIDVESKKVVGIESFGYLANHKERKLPRHFDQYSKAISHLNGELVVDKANQCVIVDDCQNEYFCYEFICMYGGDTYYVYIDAQDYSEREILKVITAVEGDYTM
ncbi:MAG: germination protein YpeB [Clostridia bacterium]|nr:germination protein YpeB [Clostridia bacterium]